MSYMTPFAKIEKKIFAETDLKNLAETLLHGYQSDLAQQMHAVALKPSHGVWLQGVLTSAIDVLTQNADAHGIERPVIQKKIVSLREQFASLYKDVSNDNELKKGDACYEIVKHYRVCIAITRCIVDRLAQNSSVEMDTLDISSLASSSVVESDMKGRSA